MITYKVNLNFETKETRAFWENRMLMVRDCFNFISKMVFENKIKLNNLIIHHSCYKKAREAYPELPAQIVIQIDRMVLSNYRSAKTNKHKLDKPIQMKHPCLQLDKRLYTNMTQKSFKLSSENSNKRSLVQFRVYPKFLEVAQHGHMCDPKILFNEQTKTFSLAIPFLTIYPTPENEDILGVDLGCKRFATLSNGKAFVDKEYLKERRRIRYLKRMFWSKKATTKSNSSKKKLKKISHKERNISKNMYHHVANEILKEKESIIVLEDLKKIKQKTAKFKNSNKKRTKHNNRLSQIPFYLFKEILSYKALLAGRQVATVSPSFTSQMDCRNQSKDGCLRKGCRFYAADGLVFDADWNAAINIAQRKKHPITFDLPLDGRLNLIGRVCQRPNRGLDESKDSINLQAANSSGSR